MKLNIMRVMTAVAAAGFLAGASVLKAQSDQGQQGQGQKDQQQQQGQQGQSGQSDQTGQSGQSSQTGQDQSQQGTSISDPSGMQGVAENPTEFIKRAYQGNLTEIQLGQLAQQKGQTQSVKDFGKHLVEGHQSLNDKLTQLAAQKNITLDNKLDQKHQAMIDRLQRAQGQDFDRHFVNEQVMLHKRDLSLYQQAADKNTDQQVKSFAQSSVPALQQHLQMAQTQATTINEAAGAEQKGWKFWKKDKTQDQKDQQQQQDQQNQQQQQQPQSQPQP